MQENPRLDQKALDKITDKVLAHGPAKKRKPAPQPKSAPENS
jgi:hypothetical protein